MTFKRNPAFFSKFFNAKPKRVALQAPKRRLLRTEALEERSLLAATVGIEATDSTARETPAGSTDYATFAITRSGETDYSQPLTVYFQTSGTAGSRFPVRGGCRSRVRQSGQLRFSAPPLRPHGSAELHARHPP